MCQELVFLLIINVTAEMQLVCRFVFMFVFIVFIVFSLLFDRTLCSRRVNNCPIIICISYVLLVLCLLGVIVYCCVLVLWEACLIVGDLLCVINLCVYWSRECKLEEAVSVRVRSATVFLVSVYFFFIICYIFVLSLYLAYVYLDIFTCTIFIFR